MRPNITISIPTPYLALEEFCRVTGMTEGNARDMVRDGRLPIRPKGDKARGTVLVNVAALTAEALSECNISLNA
ncbi:regulator [Cronobacter sakazakii]|uniref:regulator n=1 Tax=Cronobacter sakazakii TaxID=28141 RepID=UPI000A18CDB6|nr:regulator [Cronobacter sakazakii]RWT63073.1 regulator [Enterobacter cloacae]EGT5207534.1 regulator [Cronobacter sakazakii]EGT5755238.1 regulator [Cronobacter sakazakii]EGZ6858537.1 regulator [Cronobacter sakazakii]EGZ6867469.1 regulator [Cronobacter sakazakii]